MAHLPETNPFIGSVLTDARHDPESDVESINAPAFQACLEAVAQARAGRQSASVLVSGIPGSGKTHLLARLRVHLEALSRNDPHALALFVYVPLHTHPRRLWRHVREQVVEDLWRPLDGHSFLHRTLGLRLACLNGKRHRAGLWTAYLKQPVKDDEGTAAFVNEIVKDRNLAVVLTHLLLERHRLEARAWLRGDSLPEQALQRLGVAIEDNEEDEDPEGRARRVVLALCRLASPQPFVFCFDQVEALEVEGDRKAGFETFGRMGAGLHDHADHLALISCIQTAHRQDLIEHVRGADRDRIFKTQAALLPLNQRQAQALVRRRLDAVPELAELRRRQPAESLWPLREEQIRDFVEKEQGLARQLIVRCRELYDQARGLAPRAAEDRTEFLERTWNERHRRHLREGTVEEADGILHTALPEAVRLARPEWRRAEPPVTDVELSLAGGTQTLHVSLCNHENMTSLAGRLRRLRQAGPALPAPSLVLLRHPARPLSRTAKKARQYLDELTAAGARLVQPSEEAFAALAVLREMLAEAQAGDLHCRGESLPAGEVRDWLSAHLGPELRELVESLLATTASEPGTGDLWLLQALLQFLDEQPITTLDEASRALDEPSGKVAACVRSAPEHFRMLDGEPAVLYRYVPEEDDG